MISSDAPLIGLDVGHVRIGVARALPAVGFASPLTTISNDDTATAQIKQLCEQERAQAVVVGLPRNLNGDDTAQTVYVRQFTAALRNSLAVPVHFQDEALTSRQAEQELNKRGKPYKKADVDALAATYILEDYLTQTGEVSHG